MISISVTQARQEIFRLTDDRDFVGAYRFLISKGFTVESAPALWELLARRCSDLGALSLATDLQQALWDVGVFTTDAAINLANDALNRNDFPKAEALITEVFGQEPEDASARQILARAISEDAPRRALDLIGRDALKTADNAVSTVDLLRRNENILDALKLVREAQKKFPKDVRLKVRKARIHESLSDWPAALAEWKFVAATGGASLNIARINQVRLLLRLEQTDAALNMATEVLCSDAKFDEKIQLAATIGSSRLISSTLLSAFNARRSDADAAVDWNSISKTLLDLGMIGALVWLHRHGAPIPATIVDVMQTGLSDEKRNLMSGSDFSSAVRKQAPQMFIDHLGPSRSTSMPKRNIAKSVLIVNATLAAGGAERQLLALCSALIEAGWSADEIHLGFFSLSADRRHQHFFEELSELGVKIHHLADYDSASCELSQADQARIAMFPAQLRSDVVQVTGVVQSLKPSVLHGWQDRSALACGWVGLTNNIDKIVLSARNMQPQKRGMMQEYAAPLLRAYCQNPRVTMTANADACAKDYEAWLGLPDKSIKTLRNGIKTDLYKPIRSSRQFRRKEAEITIGGVFRLAANKRPQLWLKTIAQLREICPFTIKARLVGRGPFHDEICDLATELKLTDLEMVDNLSDPNDIYGPMDALLLMSRIEGLPNVVLEAHATGMPVAACDVGGVREALCQCSPNGGLLLPTDPSPQDAAMLLNDWLPGAIGLDDQVRQDFIERKFSMSSLADRITHIYAAQDSTA